MTLIILIGKFLVEECTKEFNHGICKLIYQEIWKFKLIEK